MQQTCIYTFYELQAKQEQVTVSDIFDILTTNCHNTKQVLALYSGT